MVKIALGTFAALLAAAPLVAQTPAPVQFDSRWNPYLGCWRIVQEHLGQQRVPVASGILVCVQPSGPSGVAVTTTLDGKTVLEQTIVADGSAQPVSQADCQGTQTSEWSRDGERLFTRVELACTGRPTRVVSGVTLIAKGQWVDAQATLIDGDHDVRLRRYQRTSDQGAAPLADTAGGQLSLDDVIEASGKVFSPALEAALVEAGGRFALDSRALRQLADSGVSPNVIDLMVAQAYPDRFQVERAFPPSPYGSSSMASLGGSSTSVFYGSSGYPYTGYDPFYNSYSYYSPFAYPYYWGSSYYPYRYGYGYGGYYNNYNYNYLYPGSVYVPIVPGSRGTAQPGSPDSPGGDGIAVKGRGYTRVRPTTGSSDSDAGAAPAERSTTSGRGVRSIGSSDSSGSSSSGSSGGSISGGSRGSDSGGGSGGGGGGGGRTAQPR